MQQLRKDRLRHLPVLFAFLGILLFINLFSATDYHLFSVLVRLNVSFSSTPGTRLLLPPVGEIRAATHWLPVQITAELRGVDLAALRSTVFSPVLEPEVMLSLVQSGVGKIVLYQLLKLVGLAALGAAAGLVLGGGRDWKGLLGAAAAGGALILVLATFLYFTYDIQAFENLEYEGMIEAAPWVLNAAWEALGQVEALGERVQAIAGNLYSALQQLEELGPVGLVQADLTVLHVSDIHNNPIAYNFASQVVESFGVDLILDTGDLTDWGTTLEAEITARIQRLGLPYFFVSGNHDSPEVVRRINALPNAKVVAGEVVSIEGLRIAGIGDLVADSYLPTPASVQELAELAERINEKWTAAEERPQIFMVHNHRVAEALSPGLFQVVVYGHTHLWGVKQVENTIYSNAGTTGAAGIRGFQSKEPLPYSLALLYFARGEDGNLALKAVDGVHVTGLGSSFSLQRTFVGDGRNSEGDVEITD